MKISILTNTISPHQLPLTKEIGITVGCENIRYIYTQIRDCDHKSFDWTYEVPKWCIPVELFDAKEWLDDAYILLSGLREFNLFEKRAAKGLKNFYMTERWFKPPIGIFRLLHPRYFGYARRLCRMMTEGALIGLPIGIHAARDMARLCGLMHGDLRCLFCAPKLDFERKPGGKIWLKNGSDDKRYCLDKMRIWAYYVEPSKFDALPVQESSDPRINQITHSKCSTPNSIRVLWVGRLLNWKRVDTIVRAVGEHANLKRADNSLPKITLDIYGVGPEEKRLKKLAAKYGDCIKFYPPVPIADVRKLMREHDVYVLSSNAYEGWGAVVSEALEEGMKVIGTYEAGSSATILPNSNLFHAGDRRRLMYILQERYKSVGIGPWTVRNGANWLVMQ